MLILTRKKGQTIYIDGEKIKIHLLGQTQEGSSQIRIGIEAPKNMTVHRKEIYELIQEKNGE